MTIFWLIYGVIAVLIGCLIFITGAATDAIQKQLDTHTDKSITAIVWATVAVTAFCIIVWPFFVGLVIYKAIKIAILKNMER